MSPLVSDSKRDCHLIFSSLDFHRELKEDCLNITSKLRFGLFGKEIERND